MQKFAALAILSIVVIIIPASVFAQVGGLSGSKLGALCVDVVDHKKIEFEPAFFHVVSKKHVIMRGI